MVPLQATAIKVSFKPSPALRCKAHDMIPLAAPRGKDCWREETRDAGVLVMTVWETQWGAAVPSPAVTIGSVLPLSAIVASCYGS